MPLFHYHLPWSAQLESTLFSIPIKYNLNVDEVVTATQPRSMQHNTTMEDVKAMVYQLLDGKHLHLVVGPKCWFGSVSVVARCEGVILVTHPMMSLPDQSVGCSSLMFSARLEPKLSRFCFS